MILQQVSAIFQTLVISTFLLSLLSHQQSKLLIILKNPNSHPRHLSHRFYFKDLFPTSYLWDVCFAPMCISYASYAICLFNVQCVHCSLIEIKKQQLNELNLFTKYWTSSFTCKATVCDKIIDFQNLSLNLNLIFKESSNTEIIMNIITLETRIQ